MMVSGSLTTVGATRVARLLRQSFFKSLERSDRLRCRKYVPLAALGEILEGVTLRGGEE